MVCAAPTRQYLLISVVKTCTLDILMHMPHSAFSHRQLGILLWFLKANGIRDAPSVKTMKTLNDLLQKSCGVESIHYKGPLGHAYCVNNIRQIVAQVCRLSLQLAYVKHVLGGSKSSRQTPLENLSIG